MVNEVFERYITRLERRGRDGKTLMNARRTLQVADEWIQAQGIDPLSLSAEDGEDYFAHLIERYSVGTCRVHLVNVRAAYTYALSRGQVSCDPTVEIELPADNRPKPQRRQALV
jgi:site-specific recombinase XerD